MSKFVGAVVGKSVIATVTLSLDTGAYSDGDLLADAQAINDVVRGANTYGLITSISLLDVSAQGAALDLFFTSLSTSWGTENSALAASLDTQAAGIFPGGAVSVVSADYFALGAGTKLAVPQLVSPIEIRGDANRRIYVAAAARGAATYSAGGLILSLGIQLD